jgi:hypothetical protein
MFNNIIAINLIKRIVEILRSKDTIVTALGAVTIARDKSPMAI